MVYWRASVAVETDTGPTDRCNTAKPAQPSDDWASKVPVFEPISA